MPLFTWVFSAAAGRGTTVCPRFAHKCFGLCVIQSVRNSIQVTARRCGGWDAACSDCLHQSGDTTAPRRIAESTKLPVVLYNNPATCGGLSIEPETVIQVLTTAY